MTNRTFALIKPDAVKNRYTGKIYDRILQTGFTILSAKLLKMTLIQAEGFEKFLAVKFVGTKRFGIDGGEADAGTIRKDFATSLGENAVHGSDSDENAEKEIAFFFTESELLSNK